MTIREGRGRGNNEDRIIGQIDIGEGFTLDDEFNKRVLEPMRENQPREEDFQVLFKENRDHRFAQGQINRDTGRVHALKCHPDFNRIKPAAAIALEYETVYGISRLNMFGHSADAVPAAEYDDFFRGCDAFVTFLDESGNQGDGDVFLSIDAKTGDFDDTKCAIEKSLDRLDRGNPNTVKYAVDNDGDPIGEVDVPRVVFHITSGEVEIFQKTMAKDKKDFTKKDEQNILEFKANLVWQTKMQLRETIRFILADKIAIDGNISDEELIAYIEQEKDEQIGDYLRSESKRNLDTYYKVYKKVVDFQKKEKLPEVEELSTVMTTKLMQEVAASYGRQAYQLADAS